MYMCTYMCMYVYMCYVYEKVKYNRGFYWDLRCYNIYGRMNSRKSEFGTDLLRKWHLQKHLKRVRDLSN